MHVMQYEITLPADYDMAVIRHRVASKGWNRNTSETCHTPAASTSQGVPVVLAEETTLSGWGVPELG